MAKYAIGMMVLRPNIDYGIIIKVKGEKKSYPEYTIAWTSVDSRFWDYTEREVDQWFKVV